MIKSITVTNPAGDSLVLELGRPEKSGFSVLSIDGLGPVHADVNLSDMAAVDGSYFTSARLGPRNIVLNLRIHGKQLVEDTRHLSYLFFPVKKKVTLLFETDTRICQIEGYVESNDPVIFSKEQTTQVSILCPDPYFYSVFLNTHSFAFEEPSFEFPFENLSLSEGLLEFGVLNLNTERAIYYPGDADIGMLITIHTDGTATTVSNTNITIYNILTGDSMELNTGRIEEITGQAFGVYGSAEEILISTMRGKKEIYLLRDGVYTNILNCLEKDSTWLTLSKGNNVFAYTADNQISDLRFLIKSYIAYLGV